MFGNGIHATTRPFVPLSVVVALSCKRGILSLSHRSHRPCSAAAPTLPALPACLARGSLAPLGVTTSVALSPPSRCIPGWTHKLVESPLSFVGKGWKRTTLQIPTEVMCRQHMRMCMCMYISQFHSRGERAPAPDRSCHLCALRCLFLLLFLLVQCARDEKESLVNQKWGVFCVFRV